MQLIVLGMHRSGTSTVARLLNMMGAYFAPAELAMPATEYNEKGYWERMDVFGVHEEMFHALGMGWDRVAHFDARRLAEPEFVAQFRPRIEQILLDLDARRPWFVKDPRLNVLLPFWQPLLEVPVCIFVHRNPIQVAQSLQKREGFPLSLGLALWEQYSLLGLAHSRAMPRLWVSYHDVMREPVEVTRRLHAQLLELEVQGLRMPSQREIEAFIEPRLYHQKGNQTLQNGFANAQQRELDQAFSDGSILSWPELPSLSAGAAEILQAHQDSLAAQARFTTEKACLGDELEGQRQQTELAMTAVQELSSELEAVRRWVETIEATAQERAVQITQLDSALEAARHTSVLLTTEIATLRNSLAWRITAPLRGIGTRFPALETQLRPVLENAGAILSLQWFKPRRATQATPSAIARDLLAVDALDPSHLPVPVDPYAAWLRVNQWNPRAEMALRDRLAACRGRLPRLSVVMPVYNPPLRFLSQAIQSIKRQIYPDWQLCIADDASTDPRVRPYLQSLAADPRLALAYRQTNGHISAATNSAAELAHGDFLLLLDQDDELTVDALAEVALYLAEHPDTDLLYSDSDKIDEHGQRYDPHFKPDWSPELLLSYMYAGQVLVVRRSLFEQLGGLRVGFEGAQDHDLALRVGEVARHVGHLPLVLYHWRCFRGSTAFSGHEKPYSFQAGRQAVQEALERRQSAGQAFQPDWAERGGNGIYQVRFPDRGPSVTIIIPTHNRPDLLQRCLQALAKTRYRDYRVMVVDNENHDPAARRYLDQLEHEVVAISNRPGQGFSFSHVMNEAVRRASTDYVLLLNDDTEVVTPEWLSSLVGLAELPGVGATGALLRYGDGKVQHAGVVHGIDGMCDHAFKLIRRGDNGFLSYIAMIRNCIAVTAACLLTRRELFLELGGFDEQRFAVAYNDPDYCYRLRERGYRIVYSPNAELLHHEGQTRGFGDKPQEIAAYRQAFKTLIDPYLNRNLSRENPCFTVAPHCLPRAPQRPLRAALFTHNLNWEGAPKQLLEIADYLHRHGGVTPLIVSPTDGALRQAYEQRGIEVRIWPHPLSRHAELPGYLEALDEIGTQLAEQAIDVVCANTLHGFYAVDAAHRAGLPSLWIVHESEDWRHYFDFVPPALRVRPIECFRYPYRVVFVAKQTRSLYRDLEFYHHFTVIPNGLEPGSAPVTTPDLRRAARASLGFADDTVAILSVGTVCDRKRQIDLIEAIGRLDESVLRPQSVRFLLVGDRKNDYSRQMHERIAMLPPARQAVLSVIPEAADVAVYYQACDVFVLTSGMESYPRVILEAMAAGLAILTTPVNGVVEQVRKGINADYFAVGDVAQLTHGLATLIQDGARRERYRQNSPLVLQGLTDYEEMGSRYATLFQEAALASVL